MQPAKKGARSVGSRRISAIVPPIPPDFIRRYGMKAMTMYRPNTIHSALSDFDRCIESFFGDSLMAPAARIFNHMPAVDVRETENAYVLDMELPGFDEKNINIHVDGANLSIASKHEEAREEKPDQGSGTYILKERRSSSFSRSFKLPENADPEAVSAAFKNGVLSMQIKKRAEAQKRMIQINAA
jgi:HSP20 family protein